MRYLFAAALLFFAPHASAHEVYVLDPSAVKDALITPSQNPFSAYAGNEFYFYFWGFVAFVVVTTVFFMMFFHVFERRFGPLFLRLRPYVPTILRLTVGVVLIEFAYQGALFGPELPFAFAFDGLETFVRVLFALSGVALLLNVAVRAAVLAALLLVLVGAVYWGPYTLTYVAHVGALVAVYLLDQGRKNRIERALLPYAMAIARVAFGLSVIAAAVYAKFLYSNLALQTVLHYNLTDYFRFEPLFVVLGALIVESLIGLFILFGFEIRWTTLFFLFWLVLSLLYFGEAVWPHLALFGLNITFFIYGYDRTSLEWWLVRRKHESVVL